MCLIVFSKTFIMSDLFVVIIFFFPTCSCAISVDNSTKNCFPYYPFYNWHVLVTNDMNDNFQLSIYEVGQPLSLLCIPCFPCIICSPYPGSIYDWYFCTGKDDKLWVGEFIWGSKKISVDLFSTHIILYIY